MTSRAALLSFIVNSHKCERYIGRTIESILAQTMQDYEVIVVDDASSDRPVELIRSFADPRIRLIGNQSNLGGRDLREGCGIPARPKRSLRERASGALPRNARHPSVRRATMELRPARRLTTPELPPFLAKAAVPIAN
jgi:hypothetical protein